MTRGRRPAPFPVRAADGALAKLHCAETFTLDPGHSLRKVPCLICQLPIAGAPATIIGIAVLGGDACICGGIVSDAFLIHAIHLPMTADQISEAIYRGVKFPAGHQKM